MDRTPWKTPSPALQDERAAVRATRSQDAVTVLAGLWLIGGLFSDGWAHHNVPALEGFFTPWHGGLYSGLLVAGAWFTWLGRVGGMRWYLHVPPGYGGGVVGLGVFSAGGLADMVWHVPSGLRRGSTHCSAHLIWSCSPVACSFSSARFDPDGDPTTPTP